MFCEILLYLFSRGCILFSWGFLFFVLLFVCFLIKYSKKSASYLLENVFSPYKYFQAE